MFTIKFYQGMHRQIIEVADSFTILRGEDGTAEITLHRNAGTDVRRDIRHVHPDENFDVYVPPCFDKAIIENGAGKTTEIISVAPRS